MTVRITHPATETEKWHGAAECIVYPVSEHEGFSGCSEADESADNAKCAQSMALGKRFNVP